MSERMKMLEEAGLLGCLDGTGVTSTNYKEILYGGSVCGECNSMNVNNKMDKWFDFNVCQPKNNAIVYVSGNPTICCEEDMDEEQICRCVFKLGVHSWKPDMSWFDIYGEFFLCDDEEGRHMINISGWRPVE